MKRGCMGAVGGMLRYQKVIVLSFSRDILVSGTGSRAGAKFWLLVTKDYRGAVDTLLLVASIIFWISRTKYGIAMRKTKSCPTILISVLFFWRYPATQKRIAVQTWDFFYSVAEERRSTDVAGTGTARRLYFVIFPNFICVTGTIAYSIEEIGYHHQLSFLLYSLQSFKSYTGVQRGRV